MTDDDFVIYGICRNPDCGYLWLEEPAPPEDWSAAPPFCPQCDQPGWPLTPAEADARHRVKRANREAEWDALRPGASCPRCLGGDMAHSLVELGTDPRRRRVQVVCPNCHATFTIHDRREA